MFKPKLEKTFFKNLQRYESLRISLIYFIIGIIWILFSDRIANNLVADREVLTYISIFKGWVYVLATTVILYLLISSLLKKINITSSKLIESERRLKKAQAIGNIGNWEIDLVTNKIWGSEQALALYGITSEDGSFSLKDIQSMVVEEDRAILDNALKLLLEKNIKYNVEFRINNTNIKEERYLLSIAELEYDTSGKPIRVLGVIQDITGEKLHEIMLMEKNEELTSLYEELAATDEELRQQLDEIQANRELLELSEERYKTIVNNSQDIIYSCDNNGVFITVNNRFSEITNIPVEKLIGKRMKDIIYNSVLGEIWESNF